MKDSGFVENSLNYPVKIDFDQQDKVYIAEFLDLPGCSATADTLEEAYREAQDAKRHWLSLAAEQGLPIPKPSRSEEYSGRILLRLPPSLHAMLADRAKLQATSLNQYTVHLISGAVVGDSVITQIDRLSSKLGVVERRVNELGKRLETSHSELTRQIAGMAGTTADLGFPHSQILRGSVYEAISSNPS